MYDLTVTSTGVASATSISWPLLHEHAFLLSPHPTQFTGILKRSPSPEVLIEDIKHVLQVIDLSSHLHSHRHNCLAGMARQAQRQRRRCTAFLSLALVVAFLIFRISVRRYTSPDISPIEASAETPADIEHLPSTQLRTPESAYEEDKVPYAESDDG